MNYSLNNEILNVTLCDRGAEAVSVRRGDCEYIWQGDPAYWAGQAPLLFPICGRLFTGKYVWEGNTYEMDLHGFARHSVFSAERIGENEIRFTLCANGETKKIYPFDFLLTVTWKLDGDTLTETVSFRNTGGTVLPAAVGFHPGFNVPLDEGKFEDWYLEFTEKCSPDELVLSDTCFNTGKKRAFPIREETVLPLSHDLFNVDAVFLSRVASGVTLKRKGSNRSVTLNYPQCPYLGIWHKPRSDAPYVCIEPWCGLPSYDGVVEDFATRSDMFRLAPGSEKTVTLSMKYQ